MHATAGRPASTVKVSPWEHLLYCSLERTEERSVWGPPRTSFNPPGQASYQKRRVTVKGSGVPWTPVTPPALTGRYQGQGRTGAFCLVSLRVKGNHIPQWDLKVSMTPFSQHSALCPRAKLQPPENPLHMMGREPSPLHRTGALDTERSTGLKSFHCTSSSAREEGLPGCAMELHDQLLSILPLAATPWTPSAPLLPRR